MTGDEPPAELHGDVKTFVVGSFATDPAENIVGLGSGVGDFRLKLALRGQGWHADVHHALSVITSSAGPLALGSTTGVGLTAPELVDLTWQPDLGPALTVRGRVDRLSMAFTPPHLDVVVGRQPIAFGTGLVFAPLDLVNPFFPATIDNEYRPGVDAVRIDGYAGVSGRLTGVAAWAGPVPYADPPGPAAGGAPPIGLDDGVFAIDGQVTVGVTDLQAFVGLVREDRVVGAADASSVGPVGVHGDASLTVPADDAVEDDPFVRVVVGGDGRPTGKTTLSGEVYLQTFGADTADDYLTGLANPRFGRGEVWLLGRYYGALVLSQEISSLVSGSAAVIANLADPSALVVPSVSWSVADEAVVGVGGYVAVGARPDWPTPPPGTAPPALVLPQPNSEFGLYPDALYLSMRAYF